MGGVVKQEGELSENDEPDEVLALELAEMVAKQFKDDERPATKAEVAEVYIAVALVNENIINLMRILMGENPALALSPEAHRVKDTVGLAVKALSQSLIKLSGETEGGEGGTDS